MTRTVRDNALMLQVIARHDPGDPGSADEPVPDYGALLAQDVRGLRIGVIRHFYTKDVAGNPEQVAALDAAVKLLAKQAGKSAKSRCRPCRISAPAARSSSPPKPMPYTSSGSRGRPEAYGARARAAPRRGDAPRCRLPPGGTLAPPASRPNSGGICKY
jgi:aspartyl-tRNA(Asn)/glutamyl-tRNA(Gln) amidotransferase subunit A